MLVEEYEGGGRLLDADELVGALEDILRLLVRWGRLDSGTNGQYQSWRGIGGEGECSP